GKPLPEGGTIGVAATSSPYFNRSEVLRGVEWWESQGYRVKLGRSVWAQDDYMAGAPELRARDLMDMLADPEVDGAHGLARGVGKGELPRDPDDPYVRAIAPGKATAPIVGGNLHLLVRSLSTPYEVGLDGCILFFEATHDAPWHLDGDLIQLRHAGKLDKVVGVVVGDMHDSDWSEQRPEWTRARTIEDVLERHLVLLGV